MESGPRPARARRRTPPCSSGAGCAPAVPAADLGEARLPWRAVRRALIGFLLFPTYPIYDSEYYLATGAARSCTCTRRRSRPTTRRPSIRSPSPTERCSRSSATRRAPDGPQRDRLVRDPRCRALPPRARSRSRPRSGPSPSSCCARASTSCFLAIRGYVDITFLAAVVWAAALEVERPRRGTPVFALLLVAELIRPDAWLLAGLYWLWCVPHASWPERIRWAAICAVGPVALDRARPCSSPATRCARCTRPTTSPSRSSARCRSAASRPRPARTSSA